jgi:hypothetical protein
MSVVKLPQAAKDAGHAFTLRREQLATLHNTNAQYPTLIRWRISPTGVFWDFQQDSKSFAMFEGVEFEPGSFKSYAKETLGPDLFITDWNAAEP